jgi:hypothetical protein
MWATILAQTALMKPSLPRAGRSLLLHPNIKRRLEDRADSLSGLLFGDFKEIPR